MAVDPLAGIWRKLDRAKGHVDVLRSEVMDATDGDPRHVGLARRFDKDAETVIVYAERVPEIRDSYGLLVGDTIHNFRCVLDHLWWQLAIRHLGRKPTDKEAKQIQFPILSDDGNWDGHVFLSHVSPQAAAKAKVMQPFASPGRGQPDTVEALEVLASLSNTDKHRIVNVVLTIPHVVTFVTPSDEDFVDCTAVYKPGADGELEGQIFLVQPPKGRALRVGDPVIRVPVVQTGPNPDVQLDANLSCFIAIKTDSGDTVEMLDYLEQLGAGLIAAVRAFKPLL